MEDAASVDALEGTAAKNRAKLVGINGTPLISEIPGIHMVCSFPFDMMHLLFQNLLKVGQVRIHLSYHY